MLLFKKKFLPAIRAGIKTQTIRLARTMRFRAGQRSYIPGVGYIRITSIERVALAELTDADALPDGFATADALRAEIATLYADTATNAAAAAYRLRFEVLPPAEQEAARNEKSARKAAALKPA